MSKSLRIYITLNPNKEKDLVILNYLKSTYNEAETIKSILYKIATNKNCEVQLGAGVSHYTSKDENKNDDISIEKVKKDADNNGSYKNIIPIDNEIKNMFN